VVEPLQKVLSWLVTLNLMKYKHITVCYLDIIANNNSTGRQAGTVSGDLGSVQLVDRNKVRSLFTVTEAGIRKGSSNLIRILTTEVRI